MRAALIATLLAGALLPHTPPAHAQVREGGPPPFGCTTEAAYNDATALMKAGDQDGFDALVARDDCLLLDGRQFGIIQMNFVRLNAQIRLRTGKGEIALFTSLDNIPSM